jgi:hypothetical protein
MAQLAFPERFTRAPKANRLLVRAAKAQVFGH